MIVRFLQSKTGKIVSVLVIGWIILLVVLASRNSHTNTHKTTPTKTNPAPNGGNESTTTPPDKNAIKTPPGLLPVGSPHKYADPPKDPNNTLTPTEGEVDWKDQKAVGAAARTLAVAVASTTAANYQQELAVIKPYTTSGFQETFSYLNTAGDADGGKRTVTLQTIRLQEDPKTGARLALATYDVAYSKTDVEHNYIKIEFLQDRVKAVRFTIGQAY